MGDFRVTIHAIGGHGCQREIKDGSLVVGCEEISCPDCITRRYLKQLETFSCTLLMATLEHWPGSSNRVVDNLLTRKRSGSF